MEKRFDKKMESYLKFRTIEIVGTILIGDFIMALAIHWFYHTSGIVSGGVTGVALLVNYVTKFSAGTLIFLLNIPILLLGYKFLSKRYTNYALFSSLVLSGYLHLLEKIPIPFQLSDKLLAVIIGGAMNGVGLGLLFRAGTCSGGTDILGMILKKEKDINIGTGLMFFNAILLAIAIFLFGVERVLYSLIAMFISYYILDKIELGVGETKQVLIITEKPKEVSEIIIKKLNRGVTFIEGEGGYQHRKKEIVMTVMKRRQVSQLKQILRLIDAQAFLIITDATEVKGKGFQKNML